VYYYDSDFYRQRHQERMAEMRAEYQRAQAWRRSTASASVKRYARSAWSRWAFGRRAPAFRP
jgi:inosine/xanthosine triphosphate pyrophosphatase family protein